MIQFNGDLQQELVWFEEGGGDCAYMDLNLLCVWHNVGTLEFQLFGTQAFMFVAYVPYASYFKVSPHGNAGFILFTQADWVSAADQFIELPELFTLVL